VPLGLKTLETGFSFLGEKRDKSQTDSEEKEDRPNSTGIREHSSKECRQRENQGKKKKKIWDTSPPSRVL